MSKKQDGNIKKVVNKIADSIHSDLISEYPELKDKTGLSDCMIAYTEVTQMKFVFIIDEWDAVIREAKDDETAQNNYLDLLREWFKNTTFTPKAVAAAKKELKKDIGFYKFIQFEFSRQWNELKKYAPCTGVL